MEPHEELDAILNGDEPTTPSEPEEPTQAADPAPEPGAKADDAAGDDKAKDEEADKAAGTEAEKKKDDAPPASQDKDQTTPIAALMSERDKRQAAERELEEYRKREKEREEQQKKPDWYENPEQASAEFEKKIEQRIVNERFNMSETMAKSQHGAETVDQAKARFKELAKTRPTLQQELFNHPNPYAFVMETVQRETVLSEVGNDPKAYREKVAEELLNDPEFVKKAAEKMAAAGDKAGKPNPPASLAGEVSDTGKPAQKWDGPPPLSDVAGTGF